MKIWIIGKRGLLSQAFQRKCRKKKIDYIATSRREVDLENVESVRMQFETLEFTHVLNCSGYTDVERAENEEEKAYALNSIAVALLASLSREKKKKLIHFSTDYVFSGNEEILKEDTPTSPLSIYGKSKAAGEKKLFENYPEACLVRTSWLFGREGNHFVKKMVQLMQVCESINVINDQIGQPTYADDLVEVVFSLLNQTGIFHFANKGTVSWYEWAEIIRKKLKKKNISHRCTQVNAISSSDYGSKVKRPKKAVLITDQLSAVHWDQGLEEVLDYGIK